MPPRPRREGDWRTNDEISIAGPEPRRRGRVMHVDRAKKMLLVQVGPNEAIEVPFTDAILEKSGGKPRPRVRYEVGQVVRVTDGSFAGSEAVVEEVFAEQERLRVRVMILGRATYTELSYSQVQKA